MLAKILHYNKLLINVINTTLLIVMLSACSQEAASSECQLPCWAGITPGETDPTDVQNLLIAHYGEENVSVVKATEVAIQMTWVSNDTDLSEYGEVLTSYLTGSSTIKIHFIPGDYTIADLISDIGTPTYVQILTDTRNTDTPDRKDINLLFGDPHMTAYLGFRTEDVVIEAQTSVEDLYIFSGPFPDREIGRMLSWTGYGDY